MCPVYRKREAPSLSSAAEYRVGCRRCISSDAVAEDDAANLLGLINDPDNVPDNVGAGATGAGAQYAFPPTPPPPPPSPPTSTPTPLLWLPLGLNPPLLPPLPPKPPPVPPVPRIDRSGRNDAGAVATRVPEKGVIDVEPPAPESVTSIAPPE